MENHDILCACPECRERKGLRFRRAIIRPLTVEEFNSDKISRPKIDYEDYELHRRAVMCDGVIAYYEYEYVQVG